MGIPRTFEKFKEQSIQQHGYWYDYSKVVYEHGNKKVKIICPKHNKIFEQTPNGHISGRGCKECGQERRISKRSINKKEFENLAIEMHGDKYDYLEVEYSKLSDKVKIWCNKHEKYFWQEAHSHLRGCGCGKCGLEIATHVNDWLCLSTDEFKKRAIAVHGERYDYFDSKYINARTPIKIRCKKHGNFLQLPDTHIHSGGCRKCSKNKGYSNGANQWLSIISKYKNVNIQCFENGGEYKPKNEWNLNYRFDGYLKLGDKKICLEYHGCLWHSCQICHPNREEKNPINHISYGDLHDRTIIREMIIRDILGYDIITVYECTWKEIIKKGLDPNLNLDLKEYLDNITFTTI